MPTERHEELRGGVAVITGAGAGLGAALARRAASLGMKLVLADIDAAAIATAAKDFNSKGVPAIAVPTDVSDAEAVEALAAETYRVFGSVRLLINNAAIETLGLSWDITADRWRRTLDINVMGPVNGARAFVPRMMASGDRAFIANVASIGALISVPIQAAYITSKHAVLAFTECLDLELRLVGSPISVSAVLPGSIATGIFRALPKGGAIAEKHRAQMEEMLEKQGMHVDEAATKIVDGIASGQFWVSSHPELLVQQARFQAAHLAALDAPRAPGVPE